MIPAGDFRKLQERYKAQASTNVTLDKVGELGATEDVLLRRSNLPDSMAVAMVKPLASRRKALTAQLRSGGVGGSSDTYGLDPDETQDL